MLTGSVARSRPMGVWSKGHCLLWRLSRQVLHAVWPQARETGGFLIAYSKRYVRNEKHLVSISPQTHSDKLGKIDIQTTVELELAFLNYFLKIWRFLIFPGHQADLTVI